MPVSPEVVEHVARLAHVGLEPDEVERLTHELASVLEHINLLGQVDTGGIEPTSYAVDIDNVMRDDTVTPSWPPAAVLANAPRREDDLFEVQAVLD